ncbi:MAG: hypothetical protein WCG10_08200, partial [Chlamydiota bacterium]
FRIEAKQGEAMYVENTAITLSHNELKGSSGFSALKAQDVFGDNHIYKNTFYGLGSPLLDVATLKISQDKQDSSYTIDHNQIIVLDGQNGLLLDNIQEAKVLYNEFIGADPLGIALECRASGVGLLSHQYHYNTIASGFYEAMHVDLSGLENQDLSIRDNDFASGTLVHGITYHSDAKQQRLSILNNTVQTLAEGVIIDSSSIDKSQIEVSDNSFYTYSGSSCMALSSKSSAEIMIASNKITYSKNLKGNFSGIVCDLNGEESELFIKSNTIQMHSSNDGIYVTNEKNANIQIENNEILLKGDAKGVAIRNQGAGLLLLKLFNNRAVPTFSLSNLAGTFQVEASSQDRLQEVNSSSSHYIYEGDVSFVEAS